MNDIPAVLRFIAWTFLLGLAVILVGKLMGTVQGQAQKFL